MRILLFISLVVVSCFTNSATSIIEQADSAYTNDDFQKAVNLYSNIIKTDGTSSSLYYNLGNAYYRLGQLGDAIVCYERALRLDPTNDDAKINLAFVNSKIIDKPIDRGTFITNAFDSLIMTQHADTWAWMAVISFILLLCGIGIYIFSTNVTIRKMGFFGGMILLVATIIMLIFAIRAANNTTNRNYAIITSPSVILSTSPREPKDRSEEAVLLHEGTKVEIVDSITTRTDSIPMRWYEVKIDNTNRAWINDTEIEII